jgi:hypothetical protein
MTTNKTLRPSNEDLLKHRAAQTAAEARAEVEDDDIVVEIDDFQNDE